MSDTLLHCFACEAFNPQAAPELICSQCGSDFVEIVQVERSPSRPQSAPSSSSGGPGQGNGIPGIQGMLSSILSTILPQGDAHAHAQQTTTEDSPPAHERPTTTGTSPPAQSSTHQQQLPPMSDLFSQMFSQLPQQRASSPLNESGYSRTSHAPGGSSFTWYSATSRSAGSGFPAAQTGAGQPGQFQLPLPFPSPGMHFVAPEHGAPPTHGIPDIASFLQQAFGAIPGTSAGDYASGQTFDNIISEMMNRNPQANVRAASDRAISQIKRINVTSDPAVTGHEQIGEECSICQDEYKDQETLLELRCRHVYHEECLLSWLKTNGVCPICRAAVTEVEDSPTPVEVQQEDLD